MTDRADVLALVDELIEVVDQRMVALKAGGLVTPANDRQDYEDNLQAALNRVLAEYAIIIQGYVKKGKAIPKSVYEDMTREMRGVLEENLQAAYISGATNTQAAIDSAVSIDVAWDKPNENAQQWVKDYTFDLVKGLQDTTVAQVQANIEALQRDVSDFFGKPTTLAELGGKIGEYIPDWTDRLGRVWSSEERAAMIATTEVTRASVQGDLDSAQFLADEYGIKMVPVWQTSNDETVCPICAPLNGKEQGDGWEEPPPGHVNCRCATSLRFAGAVE